MTVRDGKLIVDVVDTPPALPVATPQATAPFVPPPDASTAQGRLTMRLTPDQKKQIRSLFASGTTNKTQIARIVGTTYHTVARILREGEDDEDRASNVTDRTR